MEGSVKVCAKFFAVGEEISVIPKVCTVCLRMYTFPSEIWSCVLSSYILCLLCENRHKRALQRFSGQDSRSNFSFSGSDIESSSAVG